MTLFGARLSARTSDEAGGVFRTIADAFSDAEEGGIELIAHGVSGDLAYTARRELTTTSVNGGLREYVLRTAQVYRREDGPWKVVHRHADHEDTVVGP